MKNSEKIRVGMVLMTLCAGVAAFADEKPYDFRARLECVHTRDIRDTALTPAADEYVFAEGATIAIPADAGVVLKGAAEDFADYFKVSMLLTARVSSAGEDARSKEKPRRAAVSAAYGVTVAIDPSLGKGVHTVNVSKEGVRVEAVDERQAAQALYHLEDLMNLRRAPFLKFGAERREALFSPRMTHSAWGVDLYPDNYLRKIAHTGMDAIVIFLTEEDKTGGCPNGQDVADVIRRAARVGLDTYLYWRDNFDQRAWVHPDDPKAAEGYDAVYGRITGKYPDAKGVIFVGESFSCPFKDPHVLPLKTWHRTPEFEGDTRLHPGWYPCLEYTKLVKAVSASIRKRNPKADFVFWTYNWCVNHDFEAPRLKMLDNMQKDVSILSTFEFSPEPRELPNGFKARCDDYTLVFPGPSDCFAADAQCAKRNGLSLYAMTCTGGRTWDHGAIPYMPVPQLWKKRWDAMVKAHDEWGLSGIMEGHHMGAEPSVINELAKEAFTRGGLPFDEHLRKICARDGAADRAEKMIAAYAKWSEAQSLVPPTLVNQYSIFRNGPAYPFNALGPRIAGSLGDSRDKGDFPIDKTAHNGLAIVRFNYADDQWRQWAEGLSYFPRRIPNVERERAEIETIREAVRLSAEGDALYAEAICGLPDDERGRAARRRAALGDYLTRTYRTAVHVKQATLLEDTVLDPKATQAAKEVARREIFRLARAEYKNAEGAIPSVRCDSMLGYEPSMCYVGGEEQIRWKLRKMVETYGPSVKNPENEDRVVLTAGAMNFGEPCVQPQPRHLEASPTNGVILAAGTRVAVNGFADVVRDEFALWFDLKPIVEEVGYLAAPTNAESYALAAKCGRIRIAAADAAGARYAVRTLFQLSVPQRGTRTVQGALLPECTVEDSPSLAWRGTHFCWLPETSEFAITRALYLSALYKFNHVIVENWGAFRSERHPWYGWPNGTMTPAAVRRLAATAKKLGVTLVPQLNVYGHASLCRRDSGKHAALDFHPEYAPLFEPDGGWNWCLTNPETFSVQADLADELWELYGRPDCFHIGCDEADEFKCPVCRVRGNAALFEKVVKFHADRFASRKVKVLMWHDMLLEKGDARWKGFYANGWKSTQELAAKLPKNVVICDWHYGGRKESYPTLDHFKSLGLNVITCGWKDYAGQLEQGKYARERGLMGYLGTTWCGNRRDIGVAAAAAWGTRVSNASLQDNWRRCGQLAGQEDYFETGFVGRQDYR